MKKHKKAFTIIEVLAVIVISAALITIVLPRIIASAREARYKACRGQIAIINEQVELYYVQVGEWPRADLMDIVWDTNRFPDGMPSCPVTGYFYWTYEDTRRVAGHDENNPGSHKELGYMTIGDLQVNSQGFLAGMVKREFDVESNQYALVRYGDYKYELMEDGRTWRKVSFKKSYYNAYGSLVMEAEYYDLEYDETNRLIGKKVRRWDRRGHIQSDSYYKHFYDAEGAMKTDFVETTHDYPPSGGQLVKYKTRRDVHYDSATGAYTGWTDTTWDADGGKLGEVEVRVSVDDYWNSGPSAGLAKKKTMTYSNKDGSTTKIKTFENLQYDLDGRTIGWTLFTEDGEGKIGKIDYTSGGYDAEGIVISQAWKYFDYKPGTEPGDEGTYEYAGERQLPSIKWDFEEGKKEAYQRNTTEAGDVEQRGYYMEYDEYGREKFARFVFKNEDGVVTSIIENTNRNYDSTTGLFTGGNQTVYNPDKSIRTEKTSKDFQYDSAGRLIAFTVVADHSDGRTTGIEFSNRTYEGPAGVNYNTMTGYRRKGTETINGQVRLRYDYELRDIRRNINGSMKSYGWTKYKENGDIDTVNTCPPVCPHGSGW